MTAQLPLPFEARKLARTENPETSKAAAAVSKELRSEHHKTILAVMATGSLGWTADDIAMRCSLSRHQIGRRLNELERAGIIRKTGVTRPTPTGRMACCYEGTR